MIPPRSIALLALALAGCGAAGPSAPATPQHTPQAFAPAAPAYAFADPDRKKKLASAFPAIDAIAEDEMRRQGLPGLAIGVVIDGELAYAKGFGVTDTEKKTPPTLDTLYRIGSITKSFTALALLSLRDDGALSLDDPLARWLPEATGIVYPTRDEAPITLRQLLTHTSGLPRDGAFEYASVPGEAQIARSLRGFALQSPPGAMHRYSNLGFILLGLVAGRASRTSLREIVRARIFAPLGMTASSWDRDDLPAARFATGYDHGAGDALRPAAQVKVGATGGAGGIYSSVRDMARYVAFQLDAYPSRSGPDSGAIRRSTVREAHSTGYRSGLSVGLASAPAKGESLVHVSAFNYGFGWVSEQTCDFDDLVWHNGSMSGFMTDVRFLHDRGVGVITLTNLTPSDPSTVGNRMLEALRRTGGLAKRAPLPPPLPPAFGPAMSRFLAVYNTWDEAGYRAMLRADRKPAPTEKDELAAYRELHGACKGYAPIEVVSPIEVRFAMDCERGPFEMRVILSAADGLIDGFIGTTRDVPIPPALRAVADDITGLIRAWDEAVYQKHLARFPQPREELARFFDGIRASHGACAVSSSIEEGLDRTIMLTCDRGGALSLKLAVDPKAPDTVTGLLIHGAGGGGTCPVR